VQREPDLQRVAASLPIEGIASHELALDLVLHDIAEQACQFTGASGAAIALERDGAVVCRAAAGNTAPDLGVRINTETGLTGACWRLRQPQLCTDTDTDPRVDAEACRQLGVRSVLVLPLFSADALVGVFEVLSPLPHAFSDRDLERLQELGHSIPRAMQSAAEPEARPPSRPVLIPAPAPRMIRGAPEPPVSAAPPLARLGGRSDRQTRILRIVVLALATVLLVLLGFRWGWDRARLGSSASNSASRVQAGSQDGGASQPGSVSSLGPTPAEAAGKKPAGVPSAAGRQPSEESLVVYRDDGVVIKQNAAQREKLGDATTLDAPKAVASDQPSNPNQQPSTPTQESAPKPDEIAALTSQLALRPPSLPALQTPPVVAAPALRVSQGVTGGKLIRRIPPLYPPAARQQRIQGVVLLQAQIGKDGRVKDVTVISGNSLLGGAAITAVKQWRYEPYKLNGEPVEMSAQITMNFNLD
jgi:TonB family protein